MISMVEKLGAKGKNIRVLPKERSFVASWGSFDIVRAELEVRGDGAVAVFVNISLNLILLLNFPKLETCLSTHCIMHIFFIFKSIHL